MQNNNQDDQIIDFAEQAQRIRNLKKKQEKEQQQQTPKEPLFNLPNVTKYLAVAILLPFFILEIWNIFNPTIKAEAYSYLGFVPARWDGDMDFTALTPFSLVTYNFLHGSILHLLMNGVMLLAFGAGLEKYIGGKRMLMVFFLASLAGVLTHLAFNWGSQSPVIGASAGLSGFFGALIILLQRRNIMGITGKMGLKPFIFIWVIVSIIFGMMGSPDGSSVAWIAHLGGFFAGIVLVKYVKYFHDDPREPQ
jgi:membrane associated rhomboid family serine protease